MAHRSRNFNPFQKHFASDLCVTREFLRSKSFRVAQPIAQSSFSLSRIVHGSHRDVCGMHNVICLTITFKYL